MVEAQVVRNTSSHLLCYDYSKIKKKKQQQKKSLKAIKEKGKKGQINPFLIQILKVLCFLLSLETRSPTYP